MGLFGRATAEDTAPRTGLWGRFRGKRQVEAPDEIAIGASLPEVDVQLMDDTDGSEAGEAVALNEAFSTGTSLIVGMPGAFTPTCTKQHLPGLLENWERLKAVGIETVGVITTNDRWANEAWLESVRSAVTDSPSGSGVVMISDGELPSPCR